MSSTANAQASRQLENLRARSGRESEFPNRASGKVESSGVYDDRQDGKMGVGGLGRRAQGVGRRGA